MRQILKYCIVGILILSLSCNRPNPEIEIEHLVQRLIDADIREDLKLVVSLYDNEAVLMPPSKEEIQGIKAIEKHYQDLFKNYDFNNLRLESHETVLNGHWAVNIGTTSGLVVSSAKDSTWQVNDKYMMFLKKYGTGEWRIHHLIWNNNP